MVVFFFQLENSGWSIQIPDDTEVDLQGSPTNKIVERIENQANIGKKTSISYILEKSSS